MTETPDLPDRGWRDPRRVAAALLLAVIAAAICVPAFRAAFHCDEANVFKHVTRFASGDWSSPGRPGLLWLLLTPTLLLGDPTVVSWAMRLLAAGASVVTLAAVWRISTRPADGEQGIHPADRGWGGALALLLLGTSMSWMGHAFEVRTDTFVVPLTLLAMHLLWRDRTRPAQAVAAGLAVGAAALFSQKTLYNGVGIGLGWAVWVAVAPVPWRWRERARTAVLAAGAAGAAVALWYVLLEAVNHGGAAAQNLDLAASNAFENPRPLSYNIGALRIAGRMAEPLYWGAALGLVPAIARARRQPRALAAAVVLLVMLATMFVHRGFFLYFIASFEPYAAIVAGAGLGAGLSWLHRRRGRAGALLAGVLVVLAVGAGLWDNAGQARQILNIDNRNQIRVQREARALFPEPVPYWDSIGLLPGYPETTFFGTGPVRERKRAVLGPSMYVHLAREAEPLFFVHDYMTRDRYLRPAEQRWHWRHYLPYRPNLYLRGGRVRVQPGEPVSLDVEIVRDGPYTVRFWGAWVGAATVDGQPVQDGDVVRLRRGTATLAATAERGFGQLWILMGEGRVPEASRASEVIDWSLYPRLGRERFQSYDSRSSAESDLLTPEHDPRAARNWSVRRKRHQRAQTKRDDALGQPERSGK